MNRQRLKNISETLQKEIYTREEVLEFIEVIFETFEREFRKNQKEMDLELNKIFDKMEKKIRK